MDEKRLQQRINTKFLVNCSKRAKDVLLQERFLAYSKDISDGGVRLVISQDLQRGDKFSMSLELPDFFIPITTSGEVVWSRHEYILNGGDRAHSVFEMGVRFNHIDQKDKEKLESFLERRILLKAHAR